MTKCKHFLQVCAQPVFMVWCILSEGFPIRYESVCTTVLLDTDT